MSKTENGLENQRTMIAFTPFKESHDNLLLLILGMKETHNFGNEPWFDFSCLLASLILGHGIVEDV